MNYKSLLFIKEKTERAMSPEIIFDLKLDILLPSEVTLFLLYKPDRESISLRREMFEKLLNSRISDGALTDLLEGLRLAEGLYNAMLRSESEKTKAFIFVNLFSEFSMFCKKASEINGYGFLFERFSSFFKALSDEKEFRLAESELKSIASEISSVSKITVSTNGDNAKISRDSEENISDTLKKCAEELGITLSQKQKRPFELQKGISDAIGSLYPKQLEGALSFYNSYKNLISGEVFEYIPEIEFILGILSFTRQASKNGIPFCFPKISDKKKIHFKNAYDITLLKKDAKIVPNDILFTEKEPFFYLTGANGGGKTTYLRTVGVSALLFLAGAPVFCQDGEGYLIDSVLTHFPKDERFEGTGRFFDEVKRVEEILSAENGRSLILLNETYSTTGEEKAIEYTEALASRLSKSGSFGIYVTHQHSINETEIPFLSVVTDSSDSNRRTFKIEKSRQKSSSLAKDILEKYGLTSPALKERFGLK